MVNSEYSLEIAGLRKQLGDFALRDINLKLPKGYILGYVGQNGAGKTTTIKLIMGMLRTEEGIIKVDGRELRENEIAFKDSIGYISEDCFYPDDFTLKDIEKVMVDFYPTFKKEQFQTLLKQWELPYQKKVKEFSKGMRVRTMFAAVLARDTKLLLLDEATSGLDPVVRSEILELLQDYISDGERSVLFSTHIMSDLEQIADYIYFLDKGIKIIEAPKDELVEQYVLIKGGLEELGKTLEDKIIGIKKTKVGFEGLLSADYMDHIKKDFVIEKPSVEQIVIYHIHGLRRNAS
jgi:ABC-2 type transport system ATP-binding protein